MVKRVKKQETISKVVKDHLDINDSKGLKKETVESKTPIKKDTKRFVKKENKNKLKKPEKKHSKKYREVERLIEKAKEYSIDEALDLAKKTTTTKFDASIEVHVRLGIDVKKSDQQVRGVVILPFGTGKTKSVCVVCGAKQEKEAKAAGADIVGGEEIIQKIEKGWLDFDILVATPEMMGLLGRVAKILGPKGLMPNPKTETVTQDIGKVVKNIKKGQIEFRNDSSGVVHGVIGKVSFKKEDLKENYQTFIEALKKAKPDSARGLFIRSIYIATTMGPSIKVKP